MFDLFGSVVQRFDKRISDSPLNNVSIDQGMRDEMIESIGRFFSLFLEEPTQ